MYQELPKVWQKKLDEEIEYVRKNGFYLTDLTATETQRTLTLIMRLDGDVNDELYRFVNNSVPQDLKDKCFIQPANGYHISLQWSKEYADANLSVIAEKIGTYFRKNPINFDLKILGLYPSDNNLFVILTPPQAGMITRIRKDMTQVFTEGNATPKLQPDLDTLWLSTVRFVKQPTPEETEELIKFLPKKTFDNVTVNEICLAVSDPFFSKDSREVITEIK